MFERNRRYKHTLWLAALEEGVTTELTRDLCLEGVCELLLQTSNGQVNEMHSKWSNKKHQWRWVGKRAVHELISINWMAAKGSHSTHPPTQFCLLFFSRIERKIKDKWCFIMTKIMFNSMLVGAEKTLEDNWSVLIKFKIAMAGWRHMS